MAPGTAFTCSLARALSVTYPSNNSGDCNNLRPPLMLLNFKGSCRVESKPHQPEEITQKITYLYLWRRLSEAGIANRSSVVFSMDDVSWVVGTPKSPVPALLRLLALKLKPR